MKTKYVAFDGKEFDSSLECLKHEQDTLGGCEVTLAMCLEFIEHSKYYVEEIDGFSIDAHQGKVLLEGLSKYYERLMEELEEKAGIVEPKPKVS